MSLVAWLPLNGNLKNQGVADITISGTPSYTTGKLGQQALNLSTRITFNIPSLVGAKTWSVAFWCITKDDDTLSSDWVDIMGMHDRKSDDSASGEFRWETCYGATKGSVAIGQYNNGTYATMTTNGGTLQGTKGGWHHCIASTDFENGTVSIYLDGVLKYTKVHAGGWLLGDFWLGQNNAVNGAIQDVRIYNHALSKREIKELSKGLCMYVPLDWGGNPNMIKNSYTWMNKNLGTTNGASSSLTVSKSMVEDNTAPCHWCLKVSCVNNGTATGAWVGPYFPIGSQGLTTSDLVSGETYTYSFWAKLDSSSTATTTFTPGSLCESQTLVSSTGYTALDSNWRKHTVTFKWTSTGKLTACFYSSIPASSTVTYYLCGIKLEKGDVATPYIPNTAEAIYTSKGFGNNYLMDCSGYNNEVKAIGSNNTSCTSPKGLSGTTCGASSCINLGTAPKIQYPLTIAFWFNTSDLSVNNNRLISCTEGGGWNIEASSTNLRWTIGTGTSSNTYKYCDSTKTLTQLQDAWHHIVCTYNGLKAQMYIDGTLEKEVTHYTTATPIYYNNNNAVFLCGESGANTTTPATTYTVNTSVADFRVYATALSADDVKALYQNSVEIDKTGKIYCGNLVEV